ncbi:HlyD family efflux transporter periplasmic adaptor subunit [Nocardiopsis sp. FIRDI 009]|uniref:HlyD family efflux transporter periplasmic adaptor subunit n=1 Tax=Nocardiopsis sp. FIRDI 009 TaxID=714197 RepID=UPI000E269C47|nr:HlyD family efflux transporter periplasmic adaptor subunit [Nocardiopsis sp. FIRDI 009]
MSKKKWIIAGTGLVLLAGLGGGAYVMLPRVLGGVGGPEVPVEQAALEASVPFTVELGSVSSVMVLDATVRAAPGEDVAARNGGTVTRVWVGDGAPVENGAPIVTLSVPNTTATGGEGAEAPAAREVTLYAPRTGDVSGIGDLRDGDVVEPGAVVATVAPDEFWAVASVPSNDLYRFGGEPRDIELSIDQGPAPTTCEFVSLGPAERGGGGAPAEDGEDARGGGGGTELVCRVPAGVEAYEGVTGKLSVAVEDVSNVIAVPVTAVRGASDEGEVVVVAEDGSRQTREVALGVSDGSLVEVTEGLSVGEQILDPVPLDPRFDVPGDPEEEFAEDEYFMEGE